ncbi:MAG: transglutaminase-like domain-containing protein [bacterium]
MKKIMCIVTFLILSISVLAENYLINGGQRSKIKYQLLQTLEPASGIKVLKMSLVVPKSFSSPTYNQKIEDVILDINPQPDKKNKTEDKRGNTIIELQWKKPNTTIHINMNLALTNHTNLQTIQSQAPFPLTVKDDQLKEYLHSSELIQSNDQQIKQKAEKITQGAKTEFDAVQQILTWVIDNMRYVTPPVKYDALYSFNSGKGNCQNYSHLSAALMRAVDIPVRIVNGITLKKPFTVNMGEGDYTFKMGQGRHSWIEVYFPDLGWAPFDPQQTELFVSNRFIRIEVGIDNQETVNDGLIRWVRSRGGSAKPSFQEIIEADFVSDNIQLTCTKQNYGPRKMLLCPEVKATFQEVSVPKPPPPKKIPDKDLKQLKFTKKFVCGNLDFPRNINFAFNTTDPEKTSGDQYQMKKNFMVETAEYVTTKLTQYAQVFVLQKPVNIKHVALALHKFGGSGQLWLELRSDNKGKPGKVIATSDFKNLQSIPVKPGYDWVEFNISGEKLKLQPGEYWISLGFTGSPIVNWFYTYGKPVGPVNGTRYKSVYSHNWSGALAYEFNYKVEGLTAK